MLRAHGLRAQVTAVDVEVDFDVDVERFCNPTSPSSFHMSNTNGSKTTATVEEAISALANLGVTGSNAIATQHDPVAVLAWCQWATEQRHGGRQVGAGLIVHHIRSGERPPKRNTAGPSKREQLRQQFVALTSRFPAGSPLEPHAVLQRRRWPDDDPCHGRMTAYETTFPVISGECDECGFEAAYPLKTLGGLA